MQPLKRNVLNNLCLEQCIEGIVFLNWNIPIFAKSENIAKHLQIEIWLSLPNQKEKQMMYIR
jgi:hypothetical protein